MKRILKGIVAATMVALLSFCLAACGESSSSAETGKETSPTVEIGKTVSTDILDLTLNSVDLSFYSNGGVSAKSDTKEVTNADSVYLPSSTKVGGLAFAANKGHTLVCLEFTVKNNDRNSIKIGDSSALRFKVIYNGEEYIVNGYDLNNPDGRTFAMDYSIYSEDAGKTWFKYDYLNYLLEPGETLRIRLAGIAGFEPSNLSDQFMLKAQLINSSNETEAFVYSK